MVFPLFRHNSMVMWVIETIINHPNFTMFIGCINLCKPTVPSHGWFMAAFEPHDFQFSDRPLFQWPFQEPKLKVPAIL